jgi:transcription elongation GreA/GreB family factor
MTPVGAGLIGMSVGREISWPCPDGRPRTLKILGVKQQP